MADIKGGYKYLGVPQASGSLEETARKSATTKDPQKGSRVLRRQLNEKNTLQAVNMFALSVIRWPAGTTSRSREEIEATHVGTCNWGLYPKSSSGCWASSAILEDPAKINE